MIKESISELEYFGGDAMAAEAWRGKYALKTEKTPKDMHSRLAKRFADAEAKYNGKTNLDNKRDKLSAFGSRLPECITEYDIKQYFEDFKYIVPQGSIMSMLGHPNKIGSVSNCFVVGQPYDSYGGIIHKDQELAQLMKRRGGVGIDISTLRPSTTRVSNAAGTSTGAVSFMERYSNTTREVAQNGRRGALMITIDCRHPDVLDFINIKKDRTKVTGANISVMLHNDFMEAVKKDEDYILRFPCDIPILDKELSFLEYNKLVKIFETTDGPVYYKRVKAKEVYNAIVDNAWENAEPGQMFVDNHWDYSPDTVYPKYKGITTNPCGEIFMGQYDACRLLAINLFSMVVNAFTSEADIDYSTLYDVAYIQQRLADDLIDLEIEHINAILAKLEKDPEPDEIKQPEINLWKNILNITKSSRRTGCGFTGLGDMLAALGLKYDSDEAMSVINKVMKTKMEAELDCTIDLAILRGTFEGWDPCNEFGNASKYYKTSDEKGLIGIDRNEVNKFYLFLFKEFPEHSKRMYKYGRRNVSWSTVAPTGTVSLLTQTTSGIEPLFMPYYIRRKKVNPGDKNVRIDFVDQNGDSWMEYPILHPKFKEWIELKSKGTVFENEISNTDLKAWFEESPWYGSTANDIDWLKRIQIQQIVQKYTTHSISSTINLPNEVTKEEVSRIYMEAYDKGLKGVTVYRDGSRTGVLVKETNKNNEFSQHDAPKRPKSLPCKIHKSTSKGTEWLIAVGLLEDKPYEVFCIKDVDWPKDVTEGNIIKKSRSTYTLESSEHSIKNIANWMTDEEAAITRLISTSLRHGADIKFVVEQLNKTHGDMQSFNKVIARTIKKYIPEGVETTGHTCENCGANTIIYEEGCQKCTSCGTSKC